MATFPVFTVHTRETPSGSIHVEVRAGEVVLDESWVSPGNSRLTTGELHERAATDAASTFGESLAAILAAGPPNAPGSVLD